MHVWHHWLVHGTVPRHVARLSQSVPVRVLMVLVEHWRLSHSPLQVSVLDRRVLGENSSTVPEEEIGEVDESLGVQGVVVHDDGSGVLETSSESTDNEESHVEVGNPASDVETLNRQFPDYHEAQNASNLGSGGIVSPVEVTLVGRSGDG